jgi:benzodiazapine receptor
MMMGFFSERGLEIVIAAAAVSVVALIGGLMTDVGPWYESLRFPRLRPPNWLFGPAWTVIFILIAAAGVVAWESAENPASRFRLVALFLINGVLNLLWSPLFFKLRRPDWALYELLLFWLSILFLIVALASISSFATLLLAPYLAWVTFAGWLNWSVVQLNKPFGRDRASGASHTVRSDGRVSR